MYYIPIFKSKVDEIFNSSVGSCRENIVYCVKNGSEMRNDNFSFDQFKLKFEECANLLLYCRYFEDSIFSSLHTGHTTKSSDTSSDPECSEYETFHEQDLQFKICL